VGSGLRADRPRFVLLPDNASPEKISRPTEASDSGADGSPERMWTRIRPAHYSTPAPDWGTSTPTLASLRAHSEAIQKGLGDARFYHGGLLPQEFVLDFISITQG